MSQAGVFDKSDSLDALQTELAQTEQLMGPLEHLGHSPDKTIGVFKGGRRPKLPLRLAPAVDGQAVLPPGTTLVCQGDVWVTGEIQGVVAFR